MNRILSAALLLLVLSLCTPSLHAQSPAIGTWQGAIVVMGQELQIMVMIEGEKDRLTGTVDIPQQKASGVPLRNVIQRGDSVTFELPAGPGVAMFDGAMGADGDSITGTFAQGGVTGAFHLARLHLKKEESVPPPYLEEEITFSNGNVTLAGTLTMPKGKGPFPAVILISGSGPQDRDEEIMGFRPFRVIADHLTRNGIAVFRYDDRGVGGSTGDIASSTTQDFAGDVLAAVALLKGHKGINAKKIGLLGHSEGGIVAPIVASRSNDVDFIIMMAGSGLRGEELLVAQGKAIARAAGATDDQVAQQVAAQQRVFSALKLDRLDSLKPVLISEVRQQPGLTPEQLTQLETMIDQQLTMAGSPWFRHFLAYDPAEALRQVHCPVLILFGALDTQVPAEMNRVAIEGALTAGGNRNYRTVIFPGANHLFLEAKTGGLDEYSTANKELVPNFLATVTSFVKKQ